MPRSKKRSTVVDEREPLSEKAKAVLEWLASQGDTSLLGQLLDADIAELREEERARRDKDRARRGGKKRGQQQRAAVAAKREALRKKDEDLRKRRPWLSEKQRATHHEVTLKVLRKALGKKV